MVSSYAVTATSPLAVISEDLTVIVTSTDNGRLRFSANITIPWSSGTDNDDALKQTSVAAMDKITQVQTLVYKIDSSIQAAANLLY